ncbi:hypothetical protein BB559_002977 [Furculomyces boomerangus]|uniref:Uncharacterized protein n=1 Tax=Furculomyces boomerangus TaxID=61424 RepID=A0A2T9YQ93_9FUNG|nr:hypothetical protein BB559_002977 [Furculomyces boomerangus]
MKIALGISALFTIPLVFSKEITVSGYIEKSDFTGLDVKLVIYQNGELTTRVFCKPQKVDPSCKKNCNLEIVYNNNKIIRFNSEEIVYKHGGQTYNIDFISDKYILDGCSGVESCRLYTLPFEFKIIEAVVQ